MKRSRIRILILTVFLLAACNQMPAPVPTTVPTGPPETATTAPSPTPEPSATVTTQPSLTATPSPTPTETATPTPTETATITPEPTYVVLRGEVLPEHVVCHYGPGQPYLYKYGLVAGSNLEIIRRVERGNYIEVRAIGGDNPCWVRADYMDIKGDLQQVQPVPADEVSLPFTPYYEGYLTGVSAVRSGDEVTISWDPFVLRPGDDSEQYPYLVEAWVCQDGEFIFHPVGSWQTSVTIRDEPGCEEESWGRAYAVEKHGYTKWVKIPWPPAGEQ